MCVCSYGRFCKPLVMMSVSSSEVNLKEELRQTAAPESCALSRLHRGPAPASSPCQLNFTQALGG